MSNITQIIFQNANQRTLAPKAVVFQTLTMGIVSFVSLLVFIVLRPQNKIVYQPKVKYHVDNKTPPKISRSLLGWLPPLIRNNEESKLVGIIGLDAVTFLRFLRMFRWMFTAIAFTCCITLIPINATYNIRHIDPESRDILSMLTIRDVRGPWLAAHIVVSYVTCGLVMAYVWYNWRDMVRLRNDWFCSDEYTELLYARTLMVNVEKYRTDDAFSDFLSEITPGQPDSYTSYLIDRKVGNLPLLIERHNETVRKLERALVMLMKGGKVGSKRPTIRQGGWFGWRGKRMDAIEFYSAELQDREKEVFKAGKAFNSAKFESYGFVTMQSVHLAHEIARSWNSDKLKLAPNPKDIIWNNLTIPSAKLVARQVLGWVWLIIVSFINTVPLFVLSILANLASLTSFVPFLNSWNNISPGSFAFISGVLPPTVSASFDFILPFIFRWLSEFQGAHTRSKLDRSVIARYYGFIVVSQLVIFSLFGVMLISFRDIALQIGEHQSLKHIINNLHSLPNNINRAYIDQSSYWLTFFPLQGYLTIFDLAQIFNLVWTTIKKRLFGRTPREIMEWTKPQDFEYAVYYSNFLFMGTVALIFAPQAPLVAVAAAIVFWVSSWVYKYQLLYVFVSRVETGGGLWNVIVNRILFSIILMQLLMMLTIGLQLGFKSFCWLFTIPPVIVTGMFKYYIDQKFNNADFKYGNPASLNQVGVKKVYSDGTRLEKRFGHPALTQELFKPLVHKDMVPLLPEVYKSKIVPIVKLDERGNFQVEYTTSTQNDGIVLGPVSEGELEYDLQLYKREHGEQDSDVQSLASYAYEAKHEYDIS